MPDLQQLMLERLDLFYSKLLESLAPLYTKSRQVDQTLMIKLSNLTIITLKPIISTPPKTSACAQLDGFNQVIKSSLFVSELEKSVIRLEEPVVLAIYEDIQNYDYLHHINISVSNYEQERRFKKEEEKFNKAIVDVGNNLSETIDFYAD